MRKACFLFVPFVILVLPWVCWHGNTSAADWLGGKHWGHISGCDQCGSSQCGEQSCGEQSCGCGGREHQGLLSRLNHNEDGDQCGDYGIGMSPWFSCNCNGSYKFPVPPLYTYHWPGLYSHQLMTNYHSPWRFPAIKPYSDEPKAIEGGPRPATAQADSSGTLVQPVAAFVESRRTPARNPGWVEPMSEKLKRFYR